MRLSFILALALSANLLAYSDQDMDGVEDAADRCPDTPMSELVNTQGCTIKSLKNEHHFDISLGAGYSQMNYAANEKADTVTSSLLADYYYKNFSAQFSSSHYSSKSQTSSGSGLNDTLIAMYYRLPTDTPLTLKIGGGALLPTYDTGYHNEATDYIGSVHFTYSLEDSKTSVMGGYSYTAVNDKDVPRILSYQNVHAYYIGINYLFTDQLSAGGTYSDSDSIYTNTASIRKVSANTMYRIDSHWFGSLNYAYGLSDSASDHAADFRVGYYF